MQRQIDEILLGIQQAKAAKCENFTIKQMERTRKSLESRLEKLNNSAKRDDLVTFEELGVDRLFIDESHHFKNHFFWRRKCGMWAAWHRPKRKKAPTCL